MTGVQTCALPILSNLRSWLARVEADLSTPVTYSVVHQDEIQRRLAEQQVGAQGHSPSPGMRVCFGPPVD